MGIKGLWNVLIPYSEKKSLHEIRGQTVAVDLSGWVCDSQNVTDYYVQPKLYLRNLFFRTIYLVLADIKPVFVLEGDAPELKRDVMAARNAIQFRGAAPKPDTTSSKRPDVSRKKFKNVLRECEKLLKCMGVICVKGSGEAEATCAQLNARGLVDAVVSQDSDCFAYGARLVYRNFSVSSAAGGGAMAGSVDCYDAHKMFQSNGFGRNKMVALAILCGCDYGIGACGSSINTVVAFLHSVSDSEIIPRLLKWVAEPDYYEERSRWVAAPGRCDRCGHGGRTHGKNGCPTCATHRGCNDTGHKTRLAEVKRELSLRNRALSSGMLFPEPKVMKEFLNTTIEKIDLDDLKNPVPDLIKFVKLMTEKLGWSERYCVEKFLPLLTKYHLQDEVSCKTIEPIMIKKKRNPRGIPSYEVVWSNIDGIYEELISDDQFEDGEDPLVAWTSIERQDLMRCFYPDIVKSYEESLKKPMKEKKTRARKKKDETEKCKPKRKYNRKNKVSEMDLNNLSASLRNVNLSLKNTSKANISVSVNKLKRKLRSKEKNKNQKTIDSFVSNKRRKSSKKPVESLRYSFKNMSVNSPDDDLVEVDRKSSDIKNEHLLSMLNFTATDFEETDLSGIVENIVACAPVKTTAKVDAHLFNLVFDKYSTPEKCVRKSVLNEIQNNCSTPRDSPIRGNNFKFSANISNCSVNPRANTSYFFEKLTDDGDAFEVSVGHKSGILTFDCDLTTDYSLPHVQL